MTDNGSNNRINPDNQQSIPGYVIQGSPLPDVLSDRVILTPPAPGNVRGAVWANQPLTEQSWVADVSFRANGPERGGGNFNIWLARDGSRAVGTSSVYTVSRFEGLALLIDQYGGHGGTVRGFLNDGTTDFSSRPGGIDSVAFGHCDFSYRNLGRPSQIKIRHSPAKFSVEVDGHLCFESDKIRIPDNYNFGITAASSDNPDSFEVFKLVVLKNDPANDYAGQQQQQQKPMGDNKPQGQQQQQRVTYGKGGMKFEDVPYETDLPDQEAAKIISSEAQFADLHNRLQGVSHHLSAIFRAIGQYGGIGDQRHGETAAALAEIKGIMGRNSDRLDALEHKINALELEVRSVRDSLKRSVRESAQEIKYHVNDKHESIVEDVKSHTATGHKKLIFVIIGCQAVLVAAFVWYKRRKSMPKKYL